MKIYQQIADDAMYRERRYNTSRESFRQVATLLKHGARKNQEETKEFVDGVYGERGTSAQEWSHGGGPSLLCSVWCRKIVV